MYRALIAASLTLFLAACAATTPTVSVPDKLNPGAGQSLTMIVPAKGVQIYECRAKKDQPGAYEWAFVAPEADLFDAGGKKIGKHYAGALGIGRRQQDRGYCQGTRRCTAGGRDTLAAARCEVRGSARLFQQGRERTTRKHRRRCGARSRLRPVERRQDRTDTLYGGLLLPE